MAEYKTVREFAFDEFVEKKSRFIGHIAPVSTEEEAIAFINEMRAKYRDATHNVYAYSLRENQIKRASDDGEPQGTGGVPVLNVLNGNGLVDVCCVVTRYFGGTLLGVGGLVRAYAEGAKIAVAAADIKIMAESADLSVTALPEESSTTSRSKAETSSSRRRTEVLTSAPKSVLKTSTPCSLR